MYVLHHYEQNVFIVYYDYANPIITQLTALRIAAYSCNIPLA